jgi:aspartate/methionine/tyrosine aminotransferase
MTHYTSSMGWFEFRDAVADYTERALGFRPGLDQILACPANAIIDFVVRCVADPGDEIVYPDPGFSTYYSVISYNRMKGVGVHLKEEDGFRMRAEDVARRITRKTKLIILNTPHNPTGAVMNAEDVMAIALLAQEKGIWLLSDEVYSRITYDETHFSASVVDLCRERTIILNSLSKLYAMSGWRLGYAIGPEKLIEKMGLLLQTILSCLPVFTQAGGRAALLGNQDFLIKRVKALREQRDTLVEGLNGLPGITCALPGGAFYAFPNIRKTGMSSDEYAQLLLHEAGICAVPGSCFGRLGEGFVRFCYAGTPKRRIEETLSLMEALHRDISPEFDHRQVESRVGVGGI